MSTNSYSRYDFCRILTSSDLVWHLLSLYFQLLKQVQISSGLAHLMEVSALYAHVLQNFWTPHYPYNCFQLCGYRYVWPDGQTGTTALQPESGQDIDCANYCIHNWVLPKDHWDGTITSQELLPKRFLVLDRSLFCHCWVSQIYINYLKDGLNWYLISQS